MTQQATFWDSKKATLLAQEQALPIKGHLHEQVTTYRARLVKGLALLDEWGTWDHTRQVGTAAALKLLLGALVDATANLHRPLPETTIVACPGCYKLALPGLHNTYSCECGRLWYHHRASNFRPLPAGFWAAAMPGDQVKKSLLSDEQKTTERDS